MSQRERTRRRIRTAAKSTAVPEQFGRSTTNIELNIDELMLDGVPAAQRYQIANAVRDELAAQLTRDGLPRTLEKPTGRSRDVVSGGIMTLIPGAPAETIGVQLAGAIYQGITSGTASRGK